MHEQKAALLDGTPVTIRPLRPDDARLYPDFLAEVSPADLRLRFFSTMRELGAAAIDRLVHYDPKVAMAFAALDDAGRLLGVVRLHDDSGGREAEFAVLIRSHLKGRGLGWLLMQRIIAFAKSKGLAAVHGDVFAENTTMLLMCGELGFHVVDEPDDSGVKRVRLLLPQG